MSGLSTLCWLLWFIGIWAWIWPERFGKWLATVFRAFRANK